MSATGLNLAQRVRVRRRIKAAAMGFYAAHRSDAIYTQGSARWDGIDHHRRSYRGEYPRASDCSSSTTWMLWDATRRYDCEDFLNGTRWQSGYTGTQQNHGRRVTGRKMIGDLVFYGDQGGGVAEHVAVYVGGGLVISHGGPGVHLLAWDYRPVNEVRRYVR